jgi:hypothetical protein
MLYLLDANVLIDANRDYYPIVRVPDFWNWLVQMGEAGFIKIPLETYEEITASQEHDDALKQWAKLPETKLALELNEQANPELVSRVTYEGYADDLTDVELERIGRDPFIVAYGLVDVANRIVVTTEVSKPRAMRANRHLPDVCANFGLRSCNTFTLIRELDFATHR